MACNALTLNLKVCRGSTQNRFCHIHASMENVGRFYTVLICAVTPYLTDAQSDHIIRCMKQYPMHSITRCITAHYMMNNIDLYNTTDIRLFRATTIIYSLLIRADYPPLSIPILWKRCFKATFQQPTEDVIYEMKDAAIKKYTDDYKEFKDELLTVAMHPLRIIDWYLPNEDKAKWGVSTKR